MGSPIFLFLLIAGLVLMMFVSSRARKKQIQQAEQLQNSLEPGTWVRTGSGMYGLVADVDGDVVILRTPRGEESYWHKRAIALVEEPPFADDALDDADLIDDDITADPLEPAAADLVAADEDPAVLADDDPATPADTDPAAVPIEDQDEDDSIAPDLDLPREDEDR